MAEADIMKNLMTQIGGGMNTVFYGVLIVLVIGILALIGVIIWIKLSYKHEVLIRYIVNGGKVLSHDTAKDWEDERGVKHWKLKKERDKEKRIMPYPPGTSINRMKNGKLYHETYYLEGVGYIPIQDNMHISDIPENLFDNIPEEIADEEDSILKDKKIKEWKAETLRDWMRSNKIDTAFHAISSQDRAALGANIRKAEERRGKSWTEHLPLYAGLGALVIIVVALLIFYGDVAKPVIESKKIDLEIMKTNQLVVSALERMDKDIQVMQSNNPNAPQAPN